LLPDANLNLHVIFLSLLVNDLVDSLDTNVNFLSLLRNAKINSFDAHVNFLGLLPHAFLIFFSLLLNAKIYSLDVLVDSLYALLNFLSLHPQVSLLLNNALLAQPLSVTLDFFDHPLPLLSLSILAALN
jgi:hypothetical protein